MLLGDLRQQGELEFVGFDLARAQRCAIHYGTTGGRTGPLPSTTGFQW